MKISRLLVVTLAIVLVSGIGIPAFAENLSLTDSPGPPVSPSEEIAQPSDHDNSIFDGGAPDLVNAFEMTVAVEADDFELSEDQVLTDVHFWACDLDKPAWDGTTLQWWIFADNAGLPGTIVDNGDGVVVNVNPTGRLVAGICPEYEVDFDLDDPVPLTGGVRYWLGLHLTDTFDTTFEYWENGSPGFGNPGVASVGGTFDNWQSTAPHRAFFLTGHGDVVGGELLPIESTSLLLASAQSTTWMIPLVLSVLGIGLFVVSRKSENS